MLTVARRRPTTIPVNPAKGTGMASSRTTTITLRVSHHVLAAIDDAAKRAGKDRNSYILGWVPHRDPPPRRLVRTTARLNAAGEVEFIDEIVDAPV
jgi:hypothetical protein